MSMDRTIMKLQEKKNIVWVDRNNGCTMSIKRWTGINI